MKFYAQLNEHGVCIGVSMLADTVESDRMIEIDSFDEDKLYRKYENGVWSNEKFVKDLPMVQLSEFEQLKAKQELIQQSLDELLLGGM
ncbi:MULTISPECIES: hypothetical protein [Bacillales]|uniref:hypothetical protein n=1 Tax=Bacillales TaxID=1385 RepID=UPI001490906A|nr:MULTISPECIES: hypothetical protein [Bacillales]MED0688044.1 hypothetical protein [Anoxybacillus ayderensis]NNV04651.1 hypothetical protein [Brevibacillus sp. MCWH]